MAKDRQAGRRHCCGIFAAVLCVGTSGLATAWDSPQWVRQVGTDSHDNSYGVATDAHGNIYISGTTQGIGGVGGDPGSLGGPNQGGFDAWLAKYSAHGALLWKAQLGTPHDDVSNAVATDAKGNVYIAGRISGYLVEESYSDDAWVAKYSKDGVLLWRKQLGGSIATFASGVATDYEGNLYISGADFRSQPGADYGGYDAFVTKYSAKGTLLWIRHLAAAESDSLKGDISNGLATDSDGNVYISGSTLGSLGGANHGLEDAWVAKYSTDGKLRWKRQLGTPDMDISWGVATDGEGDVYISGETRGSLAAKNPALPSTDAWVAKYSRKGALLWMRQLGSSAWDYAFGVATDGKKNVYISGSTLGALAGANRGSDDAWAAKYSTDGVLRWKRQLGTSEMEASRGVAVDNGGDVYISGVTYGALGGAQRGMGDAFLAKYYTRR